MSTEVVFGLVVVNIVLGPAIGCTDATGGENCLIEFDGAGRGHCVQVDAGNEHLTFVAIVGLGEG